MSNFTTIEMWRHKRIKHLDKVEEIKYLRAEFIKFKIEQPYNLELQNFLALEINNIRANFQKGVK